MMVGINIYLIVMSSYSRSAGEGEATIIRCSVPVVCSRGAAAEMVALDHTGIVV